MKIEEWFWLKIVTILFVGVCPYIIAFSNPELISLSKSWETPYQPLFILMNAATSYFFFSMPKWQLPSIFLTLLTAFSVVRHPDMHDAIAGLFFISSVYALYTSHRFREYMIFYLFGGLVAFKSIMWGEVIAITTLSFYHLELLIYKQKLLNRKYES